MFTSFSPPSSTSSWVPPPPQILDLLSVPCSCYYIYKFLNTACWDHLVLFMCIEGWPLGITLAKPLGGSSTEKIDSSSHRNHFFRRWSAVRLPHQHWHVSWWCHILSLFRHPYCWALLCVASPSSAEDTPSQQKSYPGLLDLIGFVFLFDKLPSALGRKVVL